MKKIFDSSKTITIEEARKANLCSRTHVKMWAGIWYKGVLIASGKASMKSHPLQLRFSNNINKIFLHAEIAAIVSYMKRLRQDSSTPSLAKCYITVARFKRDGSIGLAKPCNVCQKAIIAFNLGGLWWSEDDNG